MIPIIPEMIRPQLKIIEGIPRRDHIGASPVDLANWLNQFSVQLNHRDPCIDNHIIRIIKESKPHNPANFKRNVCSDFFSISILFFYCSRFLRLV